MSVDDFCFENKIESFNEWVKIEKIKEEKLELLEQAFLAGYVEGKSCRDKYNYYNLNQK
jgi:hypothetical protein